MKRSKNKWILTLMCVPSVQKKGYFLPVGSLTSCGLNGTSYPHPILSMKKLEGKLLEDGITKTVIVFDDLDVKRNWILPPGYTPDTEYIFTQMSNENTLIRSLLTYRDLKDMKYEILMLSDFLNKADLCASFEKYLDEYKLLCLKCFEYPKPLLKSIGNIEKKVRESMIIEVAKRQRYIKYNQIQSVTKGQIIIQASLHIANYLAQSWLIQKIKPTFFIPSTPEEIPLMSLTSEGILSFTNEKYKYGLIGN